MKITFLNSTMRAGGAERVISSLANNFSDRGDDISILVMDDLPSEYHLNENIKYVNLDVSSNSTNIFKAILNNFFRIISTRKALKRISPDVVLAFGTSNIYTGYFARLFLKVKLIGSERSNPYLSNEKYFWKKIKNIIPPKVDGFIFQTQGAKSYYPKKIQKNSIIIPNGVFVDKLPELIPTLDERKSNTICATGRLEKVKDYNTLIKAFAIFNESNFNYTLHIYGEGSQRKRMEELIKLYNLEDKVFLEGFVSNISEKLCTHTMFVLSSLHEGMPNGLIEAMACGLPCISTNCDFGPADLIIDGENGLLVPVGDVEAMANAMKDISEDKKLGERLAKNALNIRVTHSIENISNIFRNYIKSIVEK